MRYLELHLKSHLIFSGHLKTISDKLIQAALAIGRLMPNLGGPSQSERLLFVSVVSSRLMYASPTWTDRATKYCVCHPALMKVQRSHSGSFTPIKWSQLLAYAPPGDLLVLE